MEAQAYQELANALYWKKFRDDDDFTMSTSAIFGDKFRMHTQWQTFICHNFGSGKCTIDNCIDKRGNWFTTPEEFFQTLYVACWIYQPLEKGSYIIDFTDAQMNIIRENYFLKLKKRSSSHLEGNNARSAGQGFNFLEGYEELLIQIPDANPSSLMLKAEGHTAKSLAHLLGYIKKVKTGTGETANPNLNNLALQHSRFGILDRKAENYSKSYKSLLKYLDIAQSRETVTVEETLVAILKKKGVKCSNQTNIGTLITIFEDMLDKVPPIHEGVKKDLDYYLKKAETDLRKILVELQKESLHNPSPTPRYFNEVKGDTLALECALGAMKTALDSAK